MSGRNLTQNICNLNTHICQLEHKYSRNLGAIKLLAISKTKTADTIRAAFRQGITAFGENYLQEALGKMRELVDLEIEWHFIGHIQSNKCQQIANHFSWVQSIDREKTMYLLNKHRDPKLPALNCLIQVNIDEEYSKSGIKIDELIQLARQFKQFPRLKLRGLMAIPEYEPLFEQQRQKFLKINALYDHLLKLGFELDTLSMGMSNDYEAAIAEGATMIRIGTKLFGERNSC